MAACFAGGTGGARQLVSLNVIDPTESKEVSLVAVSNAGMRFYLSCGFRCVVRELRRWRLSCREEGFVTVGAKVLRFEVLRF